jgi:hypothetical protein
VLYGAALHWIALDYTVPKCCLVTFKGNCMALFLLSCAVSKLGQADRTCERCW